jgi:putative ABC transport system permease protein
MNLLQLVLKQMRQRALASWLTLLSVLLGVALATAVMIAYRESGKVFGQSDYGYDVIVGPRGSPLQLTINTVYHLDRSPGNIPYTMYEGLANLRHPLVKIAVPYAVGDTYKGHRIVATLPKLFGFDDEGKPLAPERVIEYRPNKRYALARGRPFHPEKFEAVIGAEVAKTTGLGVGGKFKATHGNPAPGQTEDIHEQEWEVVGVLNPTHTANDGVLFIPLISFYAISGHEEGLKAHQQLRDAAGLTPPGPRPGPAPTTAPAAEEDHHEGEHHDHDEGFHVEPDGRIHLDLPKEAWEVSAVLVKARASFQAQQLMYMMSNSPLPVMAVNPATVMREFFDTFLRGSTLLLLAVAALVTLVAAVSILVSIYNSVSARRREIAILRALGATRGKVLTLICVEAGMIGLFGGVFGIVVGHLLAGGGAIFFERTLGERIDWFKPDAWEWVYLGGVVLIAVLAGLVPGLKAYRTPVATNLVAA